MIAAPYTTSTIITNISFLILVWLMAHHALYSKKMGGRLRTSLTILTTLAGWFAAVYFIGRSGLFASNQLFAPNLLLAFLILFHFLRKAYHSKKVQDIADAIPQHWIIGIQTYRAVGIVFLAFYARGLLPATFAFPAGIGDLVIGMSAPTVALLYYLKKPYSKKLAIAWNILGIIDLVIAIGTGFLSFPRPIQFIPTNPSTEMLSLLPLAFVPLFMVPLAILLHMLSLRTLMRKP